MWHLHMLPMLLITCHLANGDYSLHSCLDMCHSLIWRVFKKLVIQARVRVMVSRNFSYK